MAKGPLRSGISGQAEPQGGRAHWARGALLCDGITDTAGEKAQKWDL